MLSARGAELSSWFQSQEDNELLSRSSATSNSIPPLPGIGESGTPPSASANRAPSPSRPLFGGMTRKKVAVAVAIALAIVVVPILAIVVIATIVGPASSSRTDARLQSPPVGAPENNQASAVPATNWRQLAAWDGSGTKQTESFDVQSGEWRISWETRNEAFAGAGIFQIYVHNDRDEVVSLAANKQGPGATPPTCVARIGITS